MFFKRKNENMVITKVTKTGSQAQQEKLNRETAIEQNRKCPECGGINKRDILQLGFSSSDGKSGFFGECKECGAKWQTTY